MRLGEEHVRHAGICVRVVVAVELKFEVRRDGPEVSGSDREGVEGGARGVGGGACGYRVVGSMYAARDGERATGGDVEGGMVKSDDEEELETHLL